MPHRFTPVVTCFLLRFREKDGQPEVLVLRRSERVRTYPGLWAGVSGYLEDEPEVQAYREIQEETGLTKHDIELLAQGEPLEISDETLQICWLVHPFLFRVKPGLEIHPDWEHVEACWVSPESVRELPTVPGLAEVLDQVFPANVQKLGGCHGTGFRASAHMAKAFGHPLTLPPKKPR